MRKRIIGQAGTLSKESLLVAIGATHGNELEGVRALERVFAKLKSRRIPVKGYFIGLHGNMQATQAGRRYLGHDLNRIWREPHLSRMNTNALPEYAEMRELRELIIGFRPEIRRRAVLLDLHTTSSPNGTFWVGMPTSDLDLMRKSGAPIIHGLHEISGLPGTTTIYFGERGYLTHALEGGQHGSEQAVWNLEYILWQALEHLEMIPKGTYQKMQLEVSTMEELCASGVPQELAFQYRHEIMPNETFRSVPGLKNFQFIRKGKVLAHNQFGAVKAPASGYLLMPLYQDEGSDGYFLVKPISKEEADTY